MAFQRVELAPAVELPDLERPVRRRGDHTPAVRRQRACLDALRVTRERAYQRCALAGCHVPSTQEYGLWWDAQLLVELAVAPARRPQAIPHDRGERRERVQQPMRFTRQRSSKVI